MSSTVHSFNFVYAYHQAQVHFLGNIVIWLSGTMAMLAYLALFVVYLLRRQRSCYDLPETPWNKFCSIGEVRHYNYSIFMVKESKVFVLRGC